MKSRTESINLIKEAVGDTPYGQFIVEEFVKALDPEYQCTVVDFPGSLREIINILNAYNRIFGNLDEELKAIPIEEK